MVAPIIIAAYAITAIAMKICAYKCYKGIMAPTDSNVPTEAENDIQAANSHLDALKNAVYGQKKQGNRNHETINNHLRRNGLTDDTKHKVNTSHGSLSILIAKLERNIASEKSEIKVKFSNLTFIGTKLHPNAK